MLALIDSDSLIYKVGFAIEEKTIWNEYEVKFEGAEPDVEYITDLEQCYQTIDTLIENIMFAAEADEVLLVFTGSGNFRYDNPLGYKEHRKGTRKPTAYKEILNYMLQKYPSKMCEGYEADDYCVWYKIEHPKDTMLCAIDKDVIFQTPGLHYNYGTDDYVSVSKRKAKLFEYYQCLVGDASDGYKGCKGIGPVKAKEILKDCQTEQEMWSVVVETYESKGLTKEDAINTMRLCSMHQYKDDVVVLWEEPT
jgi:hypothetical protein